MNPAASEKTHRAFTLVELFVVVAIILIIASMLHSPYSSAKKIAKQVQCISNLRQVTIGYIIWADANTNQFPWEVSTNVGGTMELIAQGNAAAHFLPTATNFNYPRTLVCPTDKSRRAATNFPSIGNSNLSYFISMTASLKSPPSRSSTILAGDRHLSLNNQAVKAGLFETTNFTALAWTTELHNNAKNSPLGVLAFADGHCEVVKSKKLAEVVQRQSIVTNRLAIP